MLFKICLVLLCNEADAQDAVQETFCKYWQYNKKFIDEEHEKAWLIRVVINRCKDMRRFEKNHPVIDITELSDYYTTEKQGQILQEIFGIQEYDMVFAYFSTLKSGENLPGTFSYHFVTETGDDYILKYVVKTGKLSGEDLT